MTSQQPEVRRNQDGSIDFDFYRERAKTLRTAAIGDAWRAIGRAVATSARAAATWTRNRMLRPARRDSVVPCSPAGRRMARNVSR